MSTLPCDACLRLALAVLARPPAGVAVDAAPPRYESLAN